MHGLSVLQLHNRNADSVGHSDSDAGYQYPVADSAYLDANNTGDGDCDHDADWDDATGNSHGLTYTAAGSRATVY